MSKQKQTPEAKKTNKPIQQPAPPLAQTLELAPPEETFDLLLKRAEREPRSVSPADAQRLQRALGNQAVGQLGRAAENRHTDNGSAAAPAASLQSILARTRPKPAAKPVRRVWEEEEDTAQAKGVTAPEGGAVTPEVESDIKSARGGGQPLAENVRSPLEDAFGADFSDVKVHTNGRADTLNRSLSARAFTTGADIFFRSGQYDPNSSSGQELIAHELTHVVQQGAAAPTAQTSPSRSGTEEPDEERETGKKQPTSSVHLQRQPDPDPPSPSTSPSPPPTPATPSSSPTNQSSPSPPGPSAGKINLPDTDLAPSANAPSANAPPANGVPANGTGVQLDDTTPLTALGVPITAPGTTPTPLTDSPATSNGVNTPAFDATAVPPGPIQAAINNITAQTDALAAGLQTAKANLYTQIDATASQVLTHIETSRANALAQIEHAFSEQINEVHSAVESALDMLQSSREEQQDRVVAAAAARRSAVSTAQSEQAAKAQALVEEQCAAIQAHAGQEAGRATSESQARAERVRALSDQSRGSGDEPLAEAQNEAARQIAAETSPQFAAKGQELAAHVTDEAQTAVQQIQGYLQPYLENLSEGAESTFAAISDAEQQATSQLKADYEQNRQSIISAQEEVVTRLETRYSEGAAVVAELSQGAVSQVQATQAGLHGEIEAQLTTAETGLLEERNAILSAFSESPGADPADVAEAESQVLAQLTEQYNNGLNGIAQLQSDITGQLAVVGDHFDTELAETVATTESELTTATAPWLTALHEETAASIAQGNDSLVQTEAQMEAAGEQWLSQANDAYTQFSGDINGAYQETIAGLSSIVEEGLAEQAAKEQEVSQEIRNAQSQLRDEYGRLKAEAQSRDSNQDDATVQRSFLGDIWDFFSGLAEDVLAWFQKNFGDFFGTLIGGLLADLLYAIGAAAVAFSWVFSQVVNLIWGFIWGEVLIDVPGAWFFAIVGDIIAGILVIGDIRDIFKHLILKWIMGEPITWVDWLIVGMSVVSLILTFTAIGIGAAIVIDILRGLVKGGLKSAAKSILKELTEKLGKELAERLIREFGEEGAERLVRELGPDLARELTEALGERGLKELVEQFGERGVKELAEAWGSRLLKDLLKQFGATGLKTLVDDLGINLVKQLADEVGVRGLKKIVDALSGPLLKQLVDEIGVQGVKELGPDALVKIGRHLTPQQIAEFVKQLGTHATKKLAKRYGGEAMAHYGVQFFKSWKGVTDHTINHLVRGHGIKNKKISGCHDLNQLVNQYIGSTATVEKVFVHSQQRVGQYVEYIYSLIKRDGSGLPRSAQYPKTVIDGLEASLPAWKKRIVDSIDDLIRNRTFPQADSAFSVVIDGINWRGWFRNGRIDSVYPTL